MFASDLLAVTRCSTFKTLLTKQFLILGQSERKHISKRK